MNFVIILSLIIEIVVCDHPNFWMTKEWHQWKAEHGKSYESEREELERHLVLLSNREYINAHNKRAESIGFTLSMNQFGDKVSNICLD